jgi:hypothetical protein
MSTLKWLIGAVLVGFIAGDLALEAWFPMPAPAVQGCCEGWKPCPGRKPLRINGRKHYWYCGPEEVR